MKFYFPCERIDDFFRSIPNKYSRQKDHKLSLLKRQGLRACEGTAFLRKANSSEAPANYVLLLQEPGEEPILVLMRWFQIDNEEVIFFLRIIPDKYNSVRAS